MEHKCLIYCMQLYQLIKKVKVGCCVSMILTFSLHHSHGYIEIKTSSSTYSHSRSPDPDNHWASWGKSCYLWHNWCQYHPFSLPKLQWSRWTLWPRCSLQEICAPSQDHCQSLALVVRKLCVSFVDPRSHSPLLGCRLITLDKCLGIHSIEICEMARRFISKAFLSVIKIDIQDATGPLQ